MQKAFEIATLSAKVNRKKKLRLSPERSYIASYRTLLQIDPFMLPIQEKVDLMLPKEKK